jgi:hypothetical protein
MGKLEINVIVMLLGRADHGGASKGLLRPTYQNNSPQLGAHTSPTVLPISSTSYPLDIRMRKTRRHLRIGNVENEREWIAFAYGKAGGPQVGSLQNTNLDCVS